MTGIKISGKIFLQKGSGDGKHLAFYGHDPMSFVVFIKVKSNQWIPYCYRELHQPRNHKLVFGGDFVSLRDSRTHN